MKLRYLVTLPLSMLLIGHSSLSHAVSICTPEQKGPFTGTTNASSTMAYNSQANGWVITIPNIDAPEVINCTRVLAKPVSKIRSFNPDTNLDVSQTMAINIAGKSRTFYTIVATGNTFFDKYAYISASVVDLEDSRKEHDLKGVVNLKPFTSANQPTPLAGMGLSQIYLYFKDQLTAPETAKVNLGRLKIGLTRSTNTNDRILDEQELFINVTVLPNLNETCSFKDPDVKLPTALTNQLSRSGDEAGQANFSLTLSCPTYFKNKALNATLVDNGEIGNNTTILKNVNPNGQNTKANNVGIRIYDAGTNLAIKLNTDFLFGTLSNVNNPVVTKKFYAKYVANGGPAGEGTVRSSATLNVTYK